MTSIEAYTTIRTGTCGQRCAARLGLLLALLLLRMPFRYTARAVRIARRFGRRPVAADEAAALVSAVHHAGRWLPVRLACMESSLAAVMAAAVSGRRLTWSLGVQFSPAPTQYHAWVEAPGHGPIGENTETGWHYHTALRM